jgi:hypothetical protein
LCHHLPFISKGWYYFVDTYAASLVRTTQKLILPAVFAKTVIDVIATETEPVLLSRIYN